MKKSRLDGGSRPHAPSEERRRAKPLPPELLKQLRGIEIRTQRLANEQLSGTYSSVFKGQGLSFREVRAYNPGDDVRWIDWNVSARMNEPFVKVLRRPLELAGYRGDKDPAMQGVQDHP